MTAERCATCLQHSNVVIEATRQINFTIVPPIRICLACATQAWKAGTVRQWRWIGQTKTWTDVGPNGEGRIE